jgi:hypothetical protein
MTELSPDAKELLQKARAAFSPSQARLDAVRSALPIQLPASPAAAASASSPASGVGARAIAGSAWTTGHTIGAVALMSALGAGATVWILSDRADRPSRTDVASVEAPSNIKPPIAPPTLRLEESAPASETPAVRSATPTGQALPTDVALSPKSLSSARERTHVAARARVKAESPREPALEPPVSADTDSLAEEVNMLRSARAALDRGDAPQAMRLLDAHEAQFQRGTLYEERLATRVLTLCALGRADAARATAQELERAAPRSPHLPRVRASCVAQSGVK